MHTSLMRDTPGKSLAIFSTAKPNHLVQLQGHRENFIPERCHAPLSSAITWQAPLATTPEEDRCMSRLHLRLGERSHISVSLQLIATLPYHSTHSPAGCLSNQVEGGAVKRPSRAWPASSSS